MLIKLALAAVMATLLAAATATTALAIDIDPGSGRAIRLTSLGRMAFRGTGLINITINCNVTLTGTIEDDVSTTAGSNLGVIDGGTMNNCDAGSAEANFGSTPNWFLDYNGANLAASPRRHQFTTDDHEFGFHVAGQDCYYEGRIPLQLEFDRTGVADGTSNLVITLAHTADLIDVLGGSDFFCPDEGEYQASFALSPEQTLVL